MSSDASLYGECRFCLALGDHRDVMKEYLNGDCREVYYDMVLDCFNVFLITPRGANLICQGCIERLRGAVSFRNMVVNAEKDLLAACQRYQIEPVEDPPEIMYELISDVKVEEDQELEDVQSDNLELVDVQSGHQELVDVQSDDQEFVDVQSDDQELVDVQSDDQELVDVKSDDEVLATESPVLQCRDTKSPITELLTIAPPTTITSSLVELKPCFVRLARIDILECDFCHQVFNFQLNLYDHIVKIHTGGDTAVTDPEITEDNTELTKDDPKVQNIVASKENVEVKKRRSCEICDEQFVTLAGFKNHMRWHRGEKPLICGICNKQCSRKTRLEDHIATRHSTDKYKPYSCDICKKRFKVKTYIKVHIRKMHINTVRKRYKCEHCGRILQGYSCFKVHLNLHAPEKPYKCQVCDQRFYSQPSLIYHSYEHVKTRPENIYDCKTCRKVFSRPQALKAHCLNVHERIKKLKCQYCTLRFTSQASLNAHEEQHRVSPHCCTVCKKTFLYKGSLKRHSLVHTKDKPYLCDTCGRGFTKREYLVDHLNSHNGVKAYSCPGCRSKFMHGYQKTWHVKKCKAYNAKKYATQSKTQRELRK